MQLSQQKASWEFVQTVTWGKLYLPATATLPPPPPVPPPPSWYTDIFPLLPLAPCWQIYIQTDRCMGAIASSNLLFQQRGEAKKGWMRRRESIQSFDCFGLCSHTQRGFVLSSKLLLSSLLFNFFLFLFTEKCDSHPNCVWTHRVAEST